MSVMYVKLISCLGSSRNLYSCELSSLSFSPCLKRSQACKLVSWGSDIGDCRPHTSQLICLAMALIFLGLARKSL